jgi:V/A-type H+/Na+-transporting ATPase subunit A
MMQVTGEEGITMEDFVLWQKAMLIDMVYLQQDAFDEVDVSVPRQRQLESFTLLKTIMEKDYQFENKEKSRDFFTQITSLYKNLNYSSSKSPEYADYLQKIQNLLSQA